MLVKVQNYVLKQEFGTHWLKEVTELNYVTTDTGKLPYVGTHTSL